MLILGFRDAIFGIQRHDDLYARTLSKADMKPSGGALALTTSLLVAGCAGMSDAECRGANWYEVG